MMQDLTMQLMPQLLLMIWVLFLPLAACGQMAAPSAYDPVKAPLLSEEKRREFDIQLANELATYNTNTTRCEHALPKVGIDDVSECRETFFREQAAQGYEVADIVARIYQPRKGRIEQNRESYERLRRLADAGDKSALCFSPYVFGQMGQKEWPPYTGESESIYTKRGMALNLPLCAINEFYSYWNGVDGYPEDRQLAHQRLLQAAKAGLYFGHEQLFSEYSREGFDNLHTIRKALCWGRLASHHSPSAGLWNYANALRTAAWNSNWSVLIHPEFRQLAHDWDLQATPYETKPTTIEDCMHIEEEQ